MIVQVYDEAGEARVFGADQFMVCQIEPEYPRKSDRDHAERKLRQLRLRRRGKWERTEWGWQAKLRFLSVNEIGTAK